MICNDYSKTNNVKLGEISQYVISKLHITSLIIVEGNFHYINFRVRFVKKKIYKVYLFSQIHKKSHISEFL